MSVQTEADRNLDIAANHIQQAIDNLAKITVERCDGHDEWEAHYIEIITDSFNELIKIRNNLNR